MSTSGTLTASFLESSLLIIIDQRVFGRRENWIENEGKNSEKEKKRGGKVI